MAWSLGSLHQQPLRLSVLVWELRLLTLSSDVAKGMFLVLFEL